MRPQSVVVGEETDT